MPYTKLFSLCAAPALAFALGACHTLSEAECRAGDWRAVGYSDGTWGYTADRFSEHIKACGRYQIVPDRTLWQEGRQEGLKQYCTADNAVRLGREGSSMNNVCPAEQSAQLRRFYNLAYRVHMLRAEMSSDKNRIAYIRDELKRLNNGDRMGLPDENAVRRRIVSNYGEIMLKENAIRDKQRELERAEQALDNALAGR